MTIMQLIRKVLLLNGHKTEAKRIRSEITIQTTQTASRLGEANKILRRNITITHNIASAMGILK